MSGVSSPVYGSGGGSGTSIPKTIVGVHGSLVGDQTDPLTPDALSGKILDYIKLTRTALSPGDIMGNGAGGVAISVAVSTDVNDPGEVITVTDGTNEAKITVADFDEIDDQIIIVVEAMATKFRIKQVVG